MNCIPGLGHRPQPSTLASKRRWVLIIGLIAVAACGVKSSESADDNVKREYDAQYRVHIDPAERTVVVTLTIRQPRNLLRELSFAWLPGAISEVHGDGALDMDGNSLRWLPPPTGGELQWRVQVAHERGKGAYDAWLDTNWGLFRAEDIIPRAKSRSLKGSRSNTTLSFDLPTGWSSVTEYSGFRDPIVVRRPDRRFDQPTGWIVVGDIGVRRETIAGVRVAVAGPQGQAVRRMDMLALLNWTLPELAALLPEPLTRLTIVSAGEPMWRGGLSAPASLYIHADRPLISENATSTLLHELMHTVLSIRAEPGADWIIEGLAEYYSLELLKRGSAISARRHERAIAEQAEWAREAEELCTSSSTGATTALAVSILAALDKEIRDKTAGSSTLDDLLRRLLGVRGRIDHTTLSQIAADLIGQPSDALHIDQLPGCPRIAPDTTST